LEGVIYPAGATKGSSIHTRRLREQTARRRSSWARKPKECAVPGNVYGHEARIVRPALSKKGELPGAVLFACTMNAIRSPMAAAILKHLAGRRVYVASAGVRAGRPDPMLAEVMEEIGISLAAHKPHSIADLADTTFDLVVTLSPEAHHTILDMTRTMAFDVEYWPAFDPSYAEGTREQRLGAYRALRDQLFARIKRRFGLEGGVSV
jgi:protein-tyrosine-phosphatase